MPKVYINDWDSNQIFKTLHYVKKHFKIKRSSEVEQKRAKIN